MYTESYIYKKEIDWSVLMEGFTLPVGNQVIFGQQMGRFLQRGEHKDIRLYLDGVTYDAVINNVNFSKKYEKTHVKDILQIRYPRNGELARVLQAKFARSYDFIQAARDARAKGDRSIIRLPEGRKEYLAIYTTEYDDTYILEPIVSEELEAAREEYAGCDELQVENELNRIEPRVDSRAGLIEKQRTVRIRKLNRLIGQNLKLSYDYRCQLCGQRIGEEFGSSIADAHHIEYFVKSLNNDESNLLVVCPNHHRIIHDTDPKFIRNKKKYVFSNGREAPLVLNHHL